MTDRRVLYAFVRGRQGWGSRTGPEQVIVVISGWSTEDGLEVAVLPLLRAEYPDDTVEFFFHRPMDWGTLAYYAELSLRGDGTLTSTHIAGDVVAARLGPAFYATEDPDDYSSGYDGA
jgi:hypothetical protein